MHPWVAILGLLLLLTDGVTSYHRVTGVAGQSVRLPCSYTGEIAITCWGRGACSLLSCGSNIIWTDGYKVSFQKDRRYQLKGNIGERDLSLTIENTVPSDSGLYCCRIEKRGWFNDIKIIQELSIRPAPTTTTTTTTTTTPTTTTTTTTQRTGTTITHRKMTMTTTPRRETTQSIIPTMTKTNQTKTTTPTTTITTTPMTTTTIPKTTTTTTAVTTTTTTSTITTTPVPMTAKAPTSALPMATPTEDSQPVPCLSSPTQAAETKPTTPYETNKTCSPSYSCSTDGNDTVTESPDPLWHCYQVGLVKGPWMSTNQGVSIGISVALLVVLLVFVVFWIKKKYLCLGSKVELLRVIPLKESHVGALKHAALKPIQAEDNAYIIDDSH
ncbi:hepatitis A virus cellular receptor 1-like [Dama dama]|uniref:hepatitis A virus cellular receptor 1-like n=1 Tax=Dama dama TaxID=30532 RepID=UPI002A369AE7|nr:hepatitis A virus cellular receptor 1-like [Dama dama]